MADRAQFTTHTLVRWIVTAGVALFVLALVVDEALSAPALAAGAVEQVCGLCHVDWRPLAALLIIGTLVTMLVALAWGVRGRFIPPR